VPDSSTISNLARHNGTTVTVRGWVSHLRSSGKIAFVVVRDGTGLLQTVLVKSQVAPEVWERFAQLTQETSVSVTGEVRAEPRAPGGFEMGLTGLEVLGSSPIDYPIQPKEHGVDFLLDHRHLWLRSPRQVAILRVRHEIEQAIHDFFYERDFTRVDTPILTAAIGERSGLFQTEYFDEGFAYLAQTGQLYGEAAAAALGRIYTFGPTFRAEKSKTRRHLTEFWMIEPEMAFCDLTGNMDLAEELVKYLIADARKECAEDLELFAKFVDKELLARLDFVIERPFQRIPYTEAVELLKKSGEKFEFPIDYGSNLQSEHERWLTEKHFKCPVTIFNFPKEIKPFYMRSNDDGKTVAAIDLLVPGIGEIVGGSQREERLELLEDSMRRHNMDPADYKWYLDLRRYGTVPHSGFGLGFERMLMFITGISNIRDVIPFARTPGSAEF